MNLPVTRFNMRANSVQREPELQRQWAEQRTYEQLRDANPGVRVLLCFQLSFDSVLTGQGCSFIHAATALLQTVTALLCRLCRIPSRCMTGRLTPTATCT